MTTSRLILAHRRGCPWCTGHMLGPNTRDGPRCKSALDSLFVKVCGGVSSIVERLLVAGKSFLKSGQQLMGFQCQCASVCQHENRRAHASHPPLPVPPRRNRIFDKTRAALYHLQQQPTLYHLKALLYSTLYQITALLHLLGIVEQRYTIYCHSQRYTMIITI